jgi:hypothetical protein
MTPKNEALAYRIWCFCTEREWNVTAEEIGEHVGISKRAVIALLGRKRWGGRIRYTSDTEAYLGRHNRVVRGDNYNGDQAREALRWERMA